jgi:molybdate transport system substrate-binding protein
MWRALLLVAVASCAGRTPQPPVVSAAASLTDALTEVADRYERATGERVALNFAASNVLARQIAGGAAVDLFISADVAQMDAVAADIAPGTRVALLSNSLAIAVPSDRPAHFASPRDLLSAAYRRIAVGEPSSVPAGVYARHYFKRLGLWQELQPRLVPAGSVRLALAAVESGAADAAVVFRSDVRPGGRSVVAFDVPPDESPAIVYPAAILRTGDNPDAARRFLAYLQSSPARDVFVRAGFRLP